MKLILLYVLLYVPFKILKNQNYFVIPWHLIYFYFSKSFIFKM